MSNRLSWKWSKEDREWIVIRSRIEILAFLNLDPDWNAYFEWLTRTTHLLGDSQYFVKDSKDPLGTQEALSTEI